MKNVILKVLLSTMVLASTNAMAQDAELSLICLSANESDMAIYHMSIYKDQPVGIPEAQAPTPFPTQQYYTLVDVIGREDFTVLGNNEFAAYATPTAAYPEAYKFEDLKNGVKYNCEVEGTVTTQPGIIRIN